MQTPTLWTTISDEQNPQHFLDRSGSLGLDITIKDPDFKDPDIQDVMEMAQIERLCTMLLPYTHRWMSFKVEAKAGGSTGVMTFCTRKFLQTLRNILKDSVLPHLHSLTICYEEATLLPLHRVDFNGRLDMDRSLRKFFSTWDMPALRSVNHDAKWIIPVIPAAYRSSLRYFQFTLNDISARSIGPITQLLRSLPMLEGLSVKLLGTKRGAIDGGNSVELTRLNSLEYIIEDTHSESVSWLNDTITTPNVEKISLTVQKLDNNSAKEIVEALFPINANRWPRLETLSCQIDSSEGDGDAIKILCARLPRLQHLSIQTRGCIPPSSFTSYSESNLQNVRLAGFRCPPLRTLRTLRLFKCVPFTTDFVLKLREIIESPEFEAL